jgi:hypothetical protein
MLSYFSGCTDPDELTLNQDVHPRTTDFTVAEALDYLNDSLNIWYCRPGDEYGVTLVFIDTFEVELNGSNKIDKADLEDLALEIATTAGEHFYDRGATDKAPFMFEVRQAGPISLSGTVPIQSWFIMEEDEPTDETDSYPYSDPWPFGYGSTSTACGNPPTGDDAADLYRRDLREALTYGMKFGKGGYSYNRLYNICFSFSSDCGAEELPFVPADEHICCFDNPNDVTEDDNLYDRLLWLNYEGFSNYHSCLSTAEMDFYYEEMSDLAEDQLGSEGVGEDRVIVQLEVGYWTLTGEDWTIGHSMQVFYANIIEAIGTAVPLPHINP